MSEQWFQGPLLGFDTETTGVVPAESRIVQAALVTVDPVGPDRETVGWMGESWLIDPGVPIPPGASRVHGITDQKARAEGEVPVKALGEIAAALGAAIEAGTPVVAFRAGFDLTMLSYELDRHAIPQPDWDRISVVDPAVLDKRVDRYRKGKRTLGATAEHYGVELDGAHSATGDAAATVALARVIGTRFPEVGSMEPRELHEAQVRWHAEDAASLEAYFRRRGREESVERRWPLAR
ncbi:exonuclease domain-containing protein [Glycomyces xiaoerkulensis]|uniref:exonuclease domain-containing protein n=1 Tax=Glycomyces xiaoerkulensis TaxID=2038139 RepID=UPI000C2605A2|nr:exonuclease domain-containing protein [Glycomyces xiaoerkulensis]